LRFLVSTKPNCGGALRRTTKNSMNLAADTSITSSIGVGGLHDSLSSKALRPSLATNINTKAISGQTLVGQRHFVLMLASLNGEID